MVFACLFLDEFVTIKMDKKSQSNKDVDPIWIVHNLSSFKMVIELNFGMCFRTISVIENDFVCKDNTKRCIIVCHCTVHIRQLIVPIFFRLSLNISHVWCVYVWSSLIFMLIGLTIFCIIWMWGVVGIGFNFYFYVHTVCIQQFLNDYKKDNQIF